MVRDLAGQVFERLTVIEYAGKDNDGSHNLWLCQCECGKLTTVGQSKLLSGHTKSCGCLWYERINAANATHGHTVGGQTPTYVVWSAMLRRCENENVSAYTNYGGRGIVVCERWHDFANFLEDMGEKPEGLSIDRIDNGGNYEPGNCRWVTPKEQARNMRSNHMLEYMGRTQCLAAWAEEFDLSNSALHYRLKSGWSIEDAITTPMRRRESDL